MATGSNQSLKKMRTENISLVVKAASATGSQSYHLHTPIVLKSESLKLLEPPELVHACEEVALHFTRERRLEVRIFFSVC